MSHRYWDKQVGLGELVGRVVTSIDATDEKLVFYTEDGYRFLMEHSQDCCESVYIESIVGNLGDLVGERILIAEEVVGKDPGPLSEYAESYTWTFYKLASRKGYVDIRWYGSSNGYYSEGVSFFKFKKGE